MATKQARAWAYVLAYASWFVSIGLSGLLFFLLHSVIGLWYVVLDLNPWAHSAVARFYFFFGGMVWLAIIFFIEGFLRDGIKKQELWRRLRLIFSGLLILFLLIGILYWLIEPFLGVKS